MRKKSAGRILGIWALAAALVGLSPIHVPAQPDGSFTGGSSSFLPATEHEPPARLAQSPGEGDSQSSPSGSRQPEAAQAGEEIDYGQSLDEALQKERVRYENRARELDFERTKVDNEFAKQEVICRNTADEGAVQECLKVAQQDRRKKLADLEIKDIDEKTEHARRETMIRNRWASKADPSQGN